MKHLPTAEDGHAALLAHMLDRAAEARRRYGPEFDGEAIRALLGDPRCARFPTAMAFDDEALASGEFAYPEPVDDEGGRRWLLCMRTYLIDRPEQWARVVAYYLPLINYGPIVTHEHCLGFAGALLGEGPEECERALRALCDATAPAGADERTPS